MKFYIALIVLISVSFACVEPFEFELAHDNDYLVIEGFISDQSFYDTQDYPSDGRWFTVKLWKGQKISGRGKGVDNANVYLEDDLGNKYSYTSTASGLYTLLQPNFKATSDKLYRLNVITDEAEFKSTWVKAPSSENSMGDISFDEAREYKEVFTSQDNKEIIEVKGILLNTQINSLSNEEERFLRWDFEAAWEFRAPRLDDDHPNYLCYVTATDYLSQFAIHKDIKGGYTKDLVFINVDNNERVFDLMTILVKQYAIDKDYYNFLKELSNQQSGANLFSAPPYNLKTNFSSNSQTAVLGFFSVRKESAIRYYFSVQQLSYNVSNSFEEACFAQIPPFAPDDPCGNCMEYNAGGLPQRTKPNWWGR